jgi:hypothetical protein
VVANLLAGNSNLNFVGPSTLNVVPAWARLSSPVVFNPANSFNTITYSNCTNAVSNVAPTVNAAYQQLIGIINYGSSTFGRYLQLTSNSTTTFAL